MTMQKSFNDAVPYDLMVGYWAGIATVYDAKGVYQDSIQSRVAIYWHVPNKLLHFQQDQEDSVENLLDDSGYNTADVAAVRNFSQLTVDLKVTGKSCSGKDEHSGTLIDGVETRPGIYLFHLRTKDKNGRYYADYYNNQYFVGPNERHIIGPYVMAAPATAAERREFSSTRRGDRSSRVLSNGDGPIRHCADIHAHFVRDPEGSQGSSRPQGLTRGTVHSTTMSGQGIVIGGGIGGLLAARMLAARFERVTVLERYPYPADPASPAPASRRGAPQSRCLHLLMAGGAAAFDEVGARLERSPRRARRGSHRRIRGRGNAVPRWLAAADAVRHHHVRLFQVFARARAAACSRGAGERAGAGGPAGRRVARNRTTGDRRPNGRSGRFRRRRPSQPISSWTRAAVARDSRSGSARCPTGRHRRWTRLSSIPERSTCRAGSSWRHTTHPTGTAFQSRRRAVTFAPP